MTFLTFVLVLITGFYAWATFKILEANRNVVSLMANQQEAILRPYVSIGYFCPPNNASFYLKITNVGKSAAKNLRIKLTDEYFDLAKKMPALELHDFPVFKETIDSFPPGTEIIFHIAHASEVFGKESEEDLGKAKIGFSAEYRFVNSNYSEKTILDFRQFFGSNVPEDYCSTSLTKIEKAINKGTDSIKKAIEKKTG